MIVGIDARAAAEVEAGRGRVVRELLSAFATLPDRHRFVLYCRTQPAELELDSRFRWEKIDAPDPLWHLRAARAASRFCDVFFSTNSYLTAWFTRIPTVVLVHDLVVFHQGAHAQRRARLIERLTIKGAVRRAASLVCVSESTRRDLCERFPAATSKSSVVPWAAASIFGTPRSEAELAETRRRHRLDEPFVLSVGTLEPRKNLLRLIDAYAGLPSEVRDGHELVLVGPQGWETDKTLRAAGADAKDVRMLGYVSEEDLASLYQLCTVFCYPSLYEGFGLPLLEALQSGAPSITSNVSSLPEVGGLGARYVDPLDVSDIRAAIATLLTSEAKRDELRRLGIEQATRFSWTKTAQTMLDALVSAAGHRQPS